MICRFVLSEERNDKRIAIVLSYLLVYPSPLRVQTEIGDICNNELDQDFLLVRLNGKGRGCTAEEKKLPRRI
jgi:hypothetical protein